MEQANNKNQEETGKLYCDMGNFKGFTVQNNIDSVNKLYFGLGLRLSDTPYIYKNEEDGNIYLGAYIFKIIPENLNNTKNIYLPANCLNLTFYHNNMIFFIKPNNELSLYKLKNDSITYYNFEPQYSSKKETPKKIKLKNKEELKIEKNKIKEISDKLVQIDKKSLNTTYETLCYILKNDLKETLLGKSKELNSKMFYFIKIDELEFTCEIEKDSKEIDSVGHILEPINVINEEIPFIKGIEKLIKYIELKNAKDESAEDYIKNDFKCPILYKNFKEAVIPSNRAILCEIKGGFAIEDVAKQIEKRIKFIHNCLFNEGEKPEYFIGIVNVYSKNVDKLKKFSELQLEFEDKVLIVSAVDYEYKGMNISYEINTDYLLFKKMDSLKQEIKEEIKKEMAVQKQEIKNEIKEEIRKGMAAQKQEIKEELKKEINQEMYAHKQEIKGEISELNIKIDNLTEALKKLFPKLSIPENKQNIHPEEKKNDN